MPLPLNLRGKRGSKKEKIRGLQIFFDKAYEELEGDIKQGNTY
jgi:hypothetical protein